MMLDVKTRKELLDEADSPNRYARNCENRSWCNIGDIIEYEGSLHQVVGHNTSAHPQIDNRCIDWSDWENGKGKVVIKSVVDVPYCVWRAYDDGEITKEEFLKGHNA